MLLDKPVGDSIDFAIGTNTVTGSAHRVVFENMADGVGARNSATFCDLLIPQGVGKVR